MGAALGAGTNELAIVAILRYILPRKKDELARRIRDVVATDLLSPDKMQRKLDDPRVLTLLQKTIADALDEALDRDLPPPALLLADHIPEIDTAAARLRDALLDEMARVCGEPSFRDSVIRPFLLERWDALRDRNPRSFLRVRDPDLTKAAASWVMSLQDSPGLKRGLRRALDGWLADRVAGADNLAALLSPEAAAGAEELAVAQVPFVVGQLAGVLGEPGIRDAIADSVMAAIDGQLRKQGLLGNIKGAVASAMRIERDVRGVCDKLPDALRENFAIRENREHFAQALRSAVRQTFHRPLSPTFRSAAKRDALVNLVADRLWRKDVFAELGRRAGEAAEKFMDRSLGESAERIGLAGLGDAALDESAERIRRMLTAPATHSLLAGQFDEMAAAWKTRPLGRLGRFVNAETRTAITTLAADEIQSMLRQRVGDFAEQAGMWDIITQSIEEYDDREIAQLVITLARRELRWVTVLGGAIGAIVGLFQSIIAGAIIR